MGRGDLGNYGVMLMKKISCLDEKQRRKHKKQHSK